MKEKIYHLGIKALIRNQSGEVLLLKVNQEKFKNPKPGSYWDIPGGRVLNDHTIEETLRREIEEETGLTTLKLFEPIDTVVSNIEIPLEGEQKAGLVLSIYSCHLRGEMNVRLSEEHTECSWFSPKEAAHLLSYKYPTSFTEKVINLLS
jgi:8-oxo-dGTP diphosphatase